MRQIVFVAKVGLRMMLTQIAREIGKRERLSAQVWPPERFHEEGVALGPDVRRLFIERLDGIAPLIDGIEPRWSQFGVSWGYVGGTGMIRVDAPNEDLPGIRAAIAAIRDDATYMGRGAGSFIAARLLAADPAWGAPAPQRAGPEMAGWATTPMMARKRIKDAQLRLGLLSFLHEGFDGFVAGDT